MNKDLLTCWAGTLRASLLAVRAREEPDRLTKQMLEDADEVLRALHALSQDIHDLLNRTVVTDSTPTLTSPIATFRESTY